MTYILVPLLVILMGLTAYSLIRGIVAFLQGTRDELEGRESTGPSANQLKQNKMMFNRILFQGAAVLIVAVLLASAK